MEQISFLETLEDKQLLIFLSGYHLIIHPQMEKQLQRLLRFKFLTINHVLKSGLDQNCALQLVQMLKLNGFREQRVMVNLESLLCM